MNIEQRLNTETKKAYLKMKGGALNFKGDSMRPLIKEGDILKVQPIEPGRLKTGDVIVYFNNASETLICHRIVGKVEINGRIKFLEKGDNSNYIDVISEDDIIGKVRCVVNNGKIRYVELHFNFIENEFLLYLLCEMIGFYKKVARAIRVVLFSGKHNKFTNLLGRVIKMLYSLLFNIVLKKEIKME